MNANGHGILNASRKQSAKVLPLKCSRYFSDLLRRSATACVCTLMLSSLGAYAEKILWPDEGYFLAYPDETLPDATQVSVAAGVSRDNNLFRLSDGQDPQTVLGESGKSDTIRRLGLGV